MCGEKNDNSNPSPCLTDLWLKSTSFFYDLGVQSFLAPFFLGGGMGHSFIGQLNGSGEREGRGLAGMG